MAQDETYQTKVYQERGGEAIVFGSGGMGRVESGGSFRKPTAIIRAGGTDYLSVAELPFSYGTVIMVGSTVVGSGSMRLGPCSVGADIMLMLVGDLTGTFTNHATQIDISISGADCLILASEGKSISGWEMYTSAASDAWVHLKCFTDDIWSIIDFGGDVDE